VCGDFDSSSHEARDFFHARSVAVIHSENQNNTDFGKSVACLAAYHLGLRLSGPGTDAIFAKKSVPDEDDPDTAAVQLKLPYPLGPRRLQQTAVFPSGLDVCVIGSLGGRVDQGLGLLGELYRWQAALADAWTEFEGESQRLENSVQASSSPAYRVVFWLVSDSSVTFVLPPGRSIIETPAEYVQGSERWPRGDRQTEARAPATAVLSPNVGIIPLFAPIRLTTSGLEWDVTDWDSRMGAMVSTSNHVVADQVIIDTDGPCLFTIERLQPEPVATGDENWRVKCSRWLVSGASRIAKLFPASDTSSSMVLSDLEERN